MVFATYQRMRVRGVLGWNNSNKTEFYTIYLHHLHNCYWTITQGYAPCGAWFSCFSSTFFKIKLWFQKRPIQIQEAVADTITWKSPYIKTQKADQQPSTVDEDEDNEIVGEEEFIKAMAEKRAILIKFWTHHQCGISRGKWKNLAHF